MDKNDNITVEITDLGVNGDGIGRADGMAVFVFGALPGETVEAHVIAVKKSYAVAKLTGVTVPSPARVKPPCPLFGRCGGCTLQHLAYAEQLEWKRKRVEDCLFRIGGIEADVAFPMPSRKDYRYRNKAAFPCENEGGYKAIGLYKHHTHHVVDIADCLVQYDEIKIIMSQLRVWIEKNDVPVYDETTGEGLLRHVITRTNRAGETMLVLVVNGEEIPKQKQLVSLFKLALPKVKSIVLNVNKQRTNAITGDKNIPLYGEPYYYDTICGMEFRVGADSFLQINPLAAEALYNDTMKKLALKPTDTVLDLFCGVGTLTLLAAKRAKAAYGIELHEGAAKDAEFNAAINGVENARFLAGDACATMDAAIEIAGRIDAVIVDPPRKGLTDALIRKICGTGAAKVAYVSCDPATLARDARAFGELGYAVSAVQPVDMFPQTGHIEVIVLLCRRNT